MSETSFIADRSLSREPQIPVILNYLQKKQLLIVNPRRKNGLILYKPYHAEFAGPGAAVGGEFDEGVIDIVPVGKLSLLMPKTPKEKINSYLIRRQWIKLAKQISDNSIPRQRAQVILNQFEHWFDAETATQLPDEAFALLVGVLPSTIRMIRTEIECL